MLFIKKIIKSIVVRISRRASGFKVVNTVNVVDHIRNMDAPLTVVKADDDVNYFSDFLDLIDLPNCHMDEVNDIEGPRWCIRHDVDHCIDVAMAIGRAEFERGYKSTYFLLTPDSYSYGLNYYGEIKNGKIIHDRSLIDKCKYLEDLGHKIGFHNDIISLSFKLRRPPDEIMEQEVEYFLKHGIKLWGTAAHGNPLARQLNYNNKEIFKGCARQGKIIERAIVHEGWEVRTHSLKLEDYGFLYEAYSLPRDSRISESGRKWGGKVAGSRIDRERLAHSFDFELFRNYIKRLNAENGVKSLQVMTHPDHWIVKDNDRMVIKKGVLV